MVFTPTMKYLRYRVQHSDVIRHVSMSQNNILAHCANWSSSIGINHCGWKDVVMGEIWGTGAKLVTLSAKQSKFGY